jgi:hypothetical protein
MEGLIEGRIVHYVVESGEHRPAIVVHVFNEETGLVNLQVFTDVSNDGLAESIIWKTSIGYSEDASITNTWHWIEEA